MTAKPRRVVITGCGLISPLGNSPDLLWQALAARTSGVRAIQQFPATSLPSPYGAEAWDFRGQIDDFGPLDGDKKKAIRKSLRLMCREIQMGVAAAQHAMVHAGIAGRYDAERSGVMFGSDHIITTPDEFADGVKNCCNDQGVYDQSRWGADGLRKVEPTWLLKYLPNMPASHIAIFNDLRGPSNSLTHREAAACLSISEAYGTILRGSADVMLTGATGTRIHPLRTLHVILQEQVATNGKPPEQLSRPFDRDRTGMVLGEGAAALVLEELDRAQARGAVIHGEIVGYGSSSVIDRQGVANRRLAIANVLRQALKITGWKPSDVGHINAHGLSTRQGDAEEAAAIRDIFGPATDRVPVAAAKGHLGNLGAGGGVVEIIASLMALKHGPLFPTLNYEHADPACPIYVAANNSTPAGDRFLKCNVTPQGQAACVAIQKFQP